MFDYHIHTAYSDDSTSDMEDMILSAFKNGYREIAITDHIDLGYPDPNFPFLLDIPTYFKDLEHYQLKYKDQIKIVKGIEIGMQDTVHDGNSEIVHSLPFDFVIASMHTSEGRDLYTGSYYRDKTALSCFRDFYTDMYQCLKAYKDYTVLGHLNIVSRYYSSYISDEPPVQTDYLDLVEDILKLVIEDGKGIEFNTSCYRYNKGLTYPSIEMLALYRKLKGEIITIGSDAHFPEHIGFGFKDAVGLLESLGFKYLTTYEKMKPKMNKISCFW